jgi:hypothetical protein
MKQIWIIGAGKFGKKAVSAMRKHAPGSAVTVVDHCSQACNAIAEPDLTVECMDGVAFLNQHLADGGVPDWIIPVIPVHLSFEWIRRRVAPDISLIPMDIPEIVLTSLPNVFPGQTGQIYTSNAAFICPENCAEPQDICTFTRLPRKRSLYEAIAAISCNDFLNIVLQSHQLAPGIGGIAPQALFQALLAVQQSTSPILLSSACRCHGVVQAFKKSH